jgi:hypothetical protein
LNIQLPATIDAFFLANAKSCDQNSYLSEGRRSDNGGEKIADLDHRDRGG